ncbi:MAG: hypothetical protein WDA75_00550 [Candidatus Latescibacterota bacterium]|jgi:hypothetical protein
MSKHPPADCGHATAVRTPTGIGAATHERWFWIELIGFDHAAPDYGVDRFLDTTGFVPEAVSLLLFNPDFVHLHDRLDPDRLLPVDCCSYAGHPRNEERERQAWTWGQLRGLVETLHRHGIAVYPAVFDLFVSDEWLGRHPEILFVRRTGERLASVCPQKRLADGSLYEDFFVDRLVRVLRDYGFDGYHGADGYGHPRLAIYDGDYSDDLVGQFLTATGLRLPATLAAPTDGDPARIRGRADWIWSHWSSAWRGFRVERFTRFWAKVTDAVHGIGRQVVLNSCWTRDPFEAVYRYGVDYRRLVRAGVDGFIVEAAAAASETEREESSARVLHDFAAMLLLLKAAMPGVPLRNLCGVKDTREQWNVLRHAPTSLEREILTLGNLYLWKSATDGADRIEAPQPSIGPAALPLPGSPASAGASSPTGSADVAGEPVAPVTTSRPRRPVLSLEPCTRGPVVCLADGIRPEEWRWLRETWDLAFAVHPVRVLGATVVWSDVALDRHLEEFPRSRGWTAHRWLHALAAHGAPVVAAVDAGHLDQVTGPLLVLHPHLWPVAELERLLAGARAPVILLGPPADGLPEPVVGFADEPERGAASCAVYGVPADRILLSEDTPMRMSDRGTAVEGEEPSFPRTTSSEEVTEPLSFLEDLVFVPVSGTFLDACAEVIRRCTGTPRVIRGAARVRVTAFELEGGAIRLLLGNDGPGYVLAGVDLERPIARLQVRSRFPLFPVVPAGSTLQVKIPGRGAVVLDAEIG